MTKFTFSNDSKSHYFYLQIEGLKRVKERRRNIVCMNRFTFDTKDCKSFSLLSRDPDVVKGHKQYIAVLWKTHKV